MKKHIVCLGDSNTHGYCADPTDCADSATLRFNEQERWTCLLQQALGAEYLVLEEGLSGRTAVFDDPLFEGLSAINYLSPCLLSHEPVDLLIVMLGTNDTKERFSASAACIALGLERLLRKAMHTDCWGGNKPNILLIAPPAIGDGMQSSTVGETMGKGCTEKSKALPALLHSMASRIGVHFLDTADCAFNQVDFMHLTQQGHRQLSEKLAELLPKLL